MSEEQGFTIGLREVYETLQGLDKTINRYVREQDVRFTRLEARQDETERDVTDLKNRRDEAERQRVTTNRQILLALVTSLIFPIVVAIAAAAWIN